MKTVELLGIKLNPGGIDTVVRDLENHLKKGKKAWQVVTLYSEFVVEAAENEDFAKVVNEAEVVTVDGMGVRIALDFAKTANLPLSMIRGLLGYLPRPVTGVELSKRLIDLSAKKGYVVMLASKLRESYAGLEIESMAGEQNVGKDDKVNEKVIKRINEYKPDVVLVAYGPVKQEMWIAKNKDKLKAKILIGVGGTFDEMLGLVPGTPRIVDRLGLKSIWRLITEPRKRYRRAYRAWVDFLRLVVGGVDTK
jgi:N-acetylglucosaminyldiphosphoundecaprenol N-acetyl-beta-D-mannosaminyltransferase